MVDTDVRGPQRLDYLSVTLYRAGLTFTLEHQGLPTSHEKPRGGSSRGVFPSPPETLGTTGNKFRSSLRWCEDAGIQY